MKFRNFIFVLLIAFSVIFIFMLGTSYAYYLTTGGVPVNVTTGNIDGVAVTFEKTQYINFNTGIPISDAYVDTMASASVFKFKPNSTVLSNRDAIINVDITDVSIDEALRVADFNYKLSCSDTSGIITNFSGDGTSFTDDVISNRYLKMGTFSTKDNTLNVNDTYTCIFRVWLRETGGNQNNLMNKKFRGLIKVSAIFK